MRLRHHPNLRLLAGGVVAGATGAAALALAAILGAHAVDIWGFDLAQSVGLVRHVVVSLVWGIAFALVFQNTTRGATIGMGVPCGLAVWLAMFYVALPLAGNFAVPEDTPVRWAIFSHAIFGLGLGVGYAPFQRSWYQPYAHPW